MDDKIKAAFDHYADEYDKQRRQFIPCFDDFYRLPLFVTGLLPENPKVLDIGAGTGLFSAFFLEVIPNAAITLIDLSEKMLELARERFRDLPNIRYIIDDFSTGPFNGEFDLIISSLSIHHLADADKQTLFTKCYNHLSSGGIFINADQVLAGTPFWEDIYKQQWKSMIVKSGLSREDILAGQERMNLDREAPLSRQLQWLEAAGFVDVDCLYKYHKFAVMLARKT